MANSRIWGGRALFNSTIIGGINTQINDGDCIDLPAKVSRMEEGKDIDGNFRRKEGEKVGSCTLWVGEIAEISTARGGESSV